MKYLITSGNLKVEVEAEDAAAFLAFSTAPEATELGVVFFVHVVGKRGVHYRSTMGFLDMHGMTENAIPQDDNEMVALHAITCDC